MLTTLQTLLIISVILGFGLPISGLTFRNKIDGEQFAIAGLTFLLTSFVLAIILIIVPNS